MPPTPAHRTFISINGLNRIRNSILIDHSFYLFKMQFLNDSCNFVICCSRYSHKCGPLNLSEINGFCYHGSSQVIPVWYLIQILMSKLLKLDSRVSFCCWLCPHTWRTGHISITLTASVIFIIQQLVCLLCFMSILQ